MTLKELATEYRESAQLLRNRLKELRAAKKTAMDLEERFWINRRIADLTPMLTQINKVAELLENYYERGYWREASISSNSLADGRAKSTPTKDLAEECYRKRTDGGSEGDVPGLSRQGIKYSRDCRGKRRKQEYGVSHAEKSRAQYPKISSISLKTDEDISNAINQFLHKKEK